MSTNLAKVMQDELAPVMTELAPHLVMVISQEEGQFEQAEEEQVRSIIVMV